MHDARLSILAAAAAALAAAWPQAAVAQSAEGTTQTVTITGRASRNAAAGIAGFGDVPLSRAPWSATVIDRQQLDDAGIAGLGDLTRLDAGASDAYNPPGYWSQLAVRGFTLDARQNVRRDGLPVNAETVFTLDNKQSLEVLKGTSGLQAGTSTPGGLLNLVVKRPRAGQRSIGLEWQQPGTVGADVDVGDRGEAFGWRVNLGAGRLEPAQRDARGSRHAAALAVDARLGAATFVEVEFETSRQQQPSVPGFSLRGDALPSAASVDPRINLNNQRWSLPVDFGVAGGSLRVTRSLTPDVDVVAHAMRMVARTDDRVAFPFGCSSGATYVYRYCSDGTFDAYDYRSEGERRTSDAVDVTVKGRAVLAGMAHRFGVGALASRQRTALNAQAYNWVGVGRDDGSVTNLPADPNAADPNTHRTDRSTELHLQDAIEVTRDWTVWAGLRHTRLQRDAVRTDGSRATSFAQSFTTPWLGLSWQPSHGHTVYASAGEGVESDVVPNRARFTNRGEALPSAKSRQFELGWKVASRDADLRVAAFDIHRPTVGWFLASTGRAAPNGLDDCSDADRCTGRLDGGWRHRGVEAEAEWRSGALALRGSAMLLKARREGASNADQNGLAPTNVPARSAKLQAAWNVAAVPGLALLAFVSHEGDRQVLPDNTVASGGWTRLDLGARWQQRLGTSTLVWRVGLDNATDRRAWKETPYQYGHPYLYPLAPRTAHASVRVAF